MSTPDRFSQYNPNEQPVKEAEDRIQNQLSFTKEQIKNQF